MKLVYRLLFIGSLVAMGCSPDLNSGETEQSFIRAWESPAASQSQAPYLFSGPDRSLWMSWIEKAEAGHRLFASKWMDGKWNPKQMLAEGNNWFVNWADYPALIANEEGHLMAHFLAKNGEGTYAYGVQLVQSFDGGQNWEGPMLLHEGETETEHGFVSMAEGSEGDFYAAWLDGRNTAISEGEMDRGPMTIRAAQINAEGEKVEEWELDKRVCDCCQTTTATTSKGPVVLYRNRSEDEIRDIAITRLLDGNWTEPRIIFPDNWNIAGCPVNGPRAAAEGDFLAVAWFSAANDSPSVKLILSQDAGESFGEPISIDKGNPLGRVDVTLLGDQTLMVSWLEKTKGKEASIMATKLDRHGSKLEEFTIAETKGGRKSGFPQMAYTAEGIFFAWTEVDSVMQVKGLQLSLD